MSRAETILDRFPTHFEAAKPGKLLGAVAAALARDLDVQFAQMAAIRRAHRLTEAESRFDLMRLAALHGIRAGELDLLDLRLDLAQAMAEALAGTDPAELAAAADDLAGLFGLDLPDGALAAYSPPADPGAPAPDPAATEAAAAGILAAAVARAALPALRRQGIVARVVEIARIHRDGNGTVAAVMRAAANALDLDLGAIEHSEDRYWHAAFARDRLRPLPDPASGVTGPAIAPDVIGIEENPLRRGSQAPAARTHAECFDLLRKGFDPAPLEIEVTAEGSRTLGPRIVNRDQGRGVGFTGAVPPGKTLTFTETGRVLLDGADVTALAYGFDGAVFADADRPEAGDFGFDAAPFVTATPPGALDRNAAFPHAGPSLPMPEIAIGRTRMAFFVQEGHFADGPVDAPLRRALPRPYQGQFSGAVFAPAPGEARAAAALVAFSWAEHQAYRARVLLPARFAALSPEDQGQTVLTRVAQALERVRPAGIVLETAFIDNHWTLGQAALPPAEPDAGGETPDASALARLRGGTLLWPAPPEGDVPPAP